MGVCSDAVACREQIKEEGENGAQRKSKGGKMGEMGKRREKESGIMPPLCKLKPFTSNVEQVRPERHCYHSFPFFCSARASREIDLRV